MTLLALLLPTLLHAAAPEWTLGLGLGPNLSKIDAVKDDLGASVGGAVWASRTWGEQHRFDISFDYLAFSGPSQSYPALSVAYGLRLFNESYLRPFAMIGLGAGQANSFPHSLKAHQTAPHAFARLGLDRLWENRTLKIGFLVDIMYVKLDGKNADSAQLALPMLTLSFPFGDDDQPAPPKPVVAARAPRDGDEDRDGVPDSRDECPGTPRGVKVNSIGCVPKTIVKKALRVEFETGSDVIVPSYLKVVDEFAAFLKASSDLEVTIEGHTDSVGGHDFNVKLSDRRAHSVARALIERGIDPGRVAAQGFGPDQPEASNDTDEGRAKNRRVVAVLR